MDIFLKDYIHLFENGDCTLAVLTALSDAKKNKNVTLHLGGGNLHFYAKYAEKRHYYISNNTHGIKSIIFPLIGFESLTVDGDDANLLFHGEILPFVIDNSNNITLKNFTVDYPNPFFFQGKIISSGKDFTEIEYDTNEFNVSVCENGYLTFYSPQDGWKMTKNQVLACEFESDTKAPSAYIPPYILSLEKKETTSFLSSMYRYLSAKKTAGNRLLFTGDLKHVHTKGNMFVCTFSGRENPGIFGNFSQNVLLSNVTLYSTGAMGVICQMCENVTLNKVKTVVNENSNRYLSVNADSTHFVNCSGKIIYKDCIFLNMLDDAGNVHGNYHKIVKKLDTNTYLLTFGHGEQDGVNIYLNGDTVKVINNKTLLPASGELTVKNSHLLSDKYIILEFEQEAPEFEEGYCTENISRMPELYIDGCITGNNRPRGFLCSTRKKTVVENCTFYNMMCGIHTGAECNDWFESGPVEDVIIRNNNFANSAYTGGAAINIHPSVKSGSTPVHKNIRIENNTFRTNGKRFLYASHTQGLVFKNNKYIFDPSLPLHEPVGENGIVLNCCTDTDIENI